MQASTTPPDGLDTPGLIEVQAPQQPHGVRRCAPPCLRQRLLWFGVAIVLGVTITACSREQQVASPDDRMLAIVETSTDPPNQSWSITATARESDIPYLLACLGDDAGASFESMRWVGPRSLEILTDAGTFEVRVDDNGRRLSLNDPGQLNGLC
jgi:hypothetical protein